jgi:outer membrane immunogenic protein
LVDRLANLFRFSLQILELPMVWREARLGLIATGVGLFALPALAADLPLKAKPFVAEPAFDWSGVYVGVHAGYGGGMKDWLSQSTDFAAAGWLAGAQIGILKQIGSLAVGVELEGAGAGIRGAETAAFGGPALGVTATSSSSSRIDGMVTLAGRAGLVADRWFVFAKGGLAGAWEKHTINVSIVGGAPNGTLTATGNEFRWGPMVGLGAEYALDRNWSIMAEYDFYHFGNRDVTFNGTATQAGVTTPFQGTLPVSQDAIHLVKVGANYRFGGVATDPSYAPVRPAPGHDWTGAYVGAQGSYGFGRTGWPANGIAFGPTAPSQDLDMSSWLAGVNGGFNVQSGVFVFGVEGEWMWTGLKGNQTTTQTDPIGIVQTLTLQTAIDWIAIASARAGFIVGDRTLVYGKAGVAIAQEKHTMVGSLSQAGVGSLNFDLAGKAAHSGIAVGVGVEYALAGNWSLKAEYNYIRMIGQFVSATGAENVNVPPLTGQINLVQGINGLSQDLNLFKAGLNYHFNPMPGPIAAKY